MKRHAKAPLAGSSPAAAAATSPDLFQSAPSVLPGERHRTSSADGPTGAVGSPARAATSAAVRGCSPLHAGAKTKTSTHVRTTTASAPIAHPPLAGSLRDEGGLETSASSAATTNKEHTK